MISPRKRTGFVLVLAVLVGTVIITLPSLADLEDISDLFSQGNYADARQKFLAGGTGTRPAEDHLWRSRLATSVDEAVGQLEAGLTVENLPLEVQQRLALELAEIHFSRKNYQECLAVLTPLVNQGEGKLVGEVYLLTGLAYRLNGNLQAAREMLASVRPNDLAFVQARYYLGAIGLQQGDYSLALRYFESGTRENSRSGHPGLESGKWRALRAEGQFQQAEEILVSLRESGSGSLALLEVNRILREEDEEMAARSLVPADQDTIATRPESRSGRYSLQLGAFSDRGLALEFLKRYKRQVTGLRIDEVRDDRGQFLYKVRSGSYVNPAIARTEAAKLKSALGIDVIIADLSGSSRYND